MTAKHTYEVNGIVAIRTESGRVEVFKRNTSDLLILDESQLEDASLVLGMAADSNRAATDERYQHAESRMIYWAAEHGRLFDIVHGKTLDKSDRDYHARVKRVAEWKAHSTTELRRLLEMFKPPDYVIELRRDVPGDAVARAAAHVRHRARESRDGDPNDPRADGAQVDRDDDALPAFDARRQARGDREALSVGQSLGSRAKIDDEVVGFSSDPDGIRTR